MHRSLISISAAFIFMAAMSARADDVIWTGKSYIPIPVHKGQDVILTMPEPVKASPQYSSQNEITEWDENSLQIRPKVDTQEQRLYMRGRKSGKLYLARLSSSLPFQPFVTVTDGTITAQEAKVAQAGVTMTSLMRAMMRTEGIPPQGFEEQLSSKVLLDSAPYKITAKAVWSSPNMVGIIATISSTVPSATIPIIPTNIQIRIPEYGALKMMGADFWEISPSTPDARVYFVYAR